MTPIEIAGLVIGTLALAAAWELGTVGRRDAFAFQFSELFIPVEIVVGSTRDEDEIRAMNAFLVDRNGVVTTVLAPSQAAAAEELLPNEGDHATVACLTRTYRVCKVREEWLVAVLPRYLAFLGRECEHGGHRDGGETQEVGNSVVQRDARPKKPK